MHSSRNDKNSVTFVEYLKNSEHYINDTNVSLNERIREIAMTPPVSEGDFSELFCVNTGSYEPVKSFTTELLTSLKKDPDNIKGLFLQVTKHVINEVFKKNGDINSRLHELLSRHNLLGKLISESSEHTIKTWILRAYFNKQIMPSISSNAYSIFDKSEVMRENIVNAFRQLLDELVKKINTNEYDHDFYDCINILDIDDFQLDLDIKPYKEDIRENKAKMDQFSHMLLFNPTPEYFCSILKNGNSDFILTDNSVLKVLQSNDWSIQKNTDANSTASNQKALLEDINRNVYFDSKLYSGKGKTAIRKTLLESMGKEKLEILDKYYTQNCLSTALMMMMSGDNFISAPTADLQVPGSQGRIGNIKIVNHIAYVKTVYPIIVHKEFNENSDLIENVIPGAIIFESQLDLSKDDGTGFVIKNIAASNQALANLLLTDDHITDIKKLIEKASIEESSHAFQKLKYITHPGTDEFDLPEINEIDTRLTSPATFDSMIQPSKPLAASLRRSLSPQPSPSSATTSIDRALARSAHKLPAPRIDLPAEEVDQEIPRFTRDDVKVVNQPQDIKDDILDESGLDIISYKKPGLVESFKPWIIAGAVILGACVTLAILAAIPALGIGAAIAGATVGLLNGVGLTASLSAGLAIGLGALSGLPGLTYLGAVSFFAKPKKIMSLEVGKNTFPDSTNSGSTHSRFAEITGTKPGLITRLDDAVSRSSANPVDEKQHVAIPAGPESGPTSCHPGKA